MYLSRGNKMVELALKKVKPDNYETNERNLTNAGNYYSTTFQNSSTPIPGTILNDTLAIPMTLLQCDAYNQNFTYCLPIES